MTEISLSVLTFCNTYTFMHICVLMVDAIEITYHFGSGYRKFFLSVTSRRQHDDVIKWKHFPRYWPFVRGIPRSPINSPHKGQWCGVLMFSLICAWINGWVNNREAGDLRRYRAHYDVIVMKIQCSCRHININCVRKNDIRYKCWLYVWLDMAQD